LHAAGGQFGILLVALIALMTSAPLVFERPAGNVALSLFADAVLVASLHAARPGGRAVALGLILAVADFVIGRLATFESARWLLVLQIVLWLLILVFVTVTILEAIFASEQVRVETLQASLCVYLLLGLTWVFLYALVELAAPGSFQTQRGSWVAGWDERSRRTDFLLLLVFSYSTLTSTGFGDVTPASGFASIVANLEALSAQVYLAVVIARLVGLQAAQPTFDQVTRSDG
jgi:hypothetical protein